MCITTVWLFGALSETTFRGNSPGTYWPQFAGLSLTAAFSSAISNRKSLAVIGAPLDHFSPCLSGTVKVLPPSLGCGGPEAALSA